MYDNDNEFITTIEELNDRLKNQISLERTLQKIRERKSYYDDETEDWEIELDSQDLDDISDYLNEYESIAEDFENEVNDYFLEESELRSRLDSCREAKEKLAEIANRIEDIITLDYIYSELCLDYLS